jgi:hypothetical protein
MRHLILPLVFPLLAACQPGPLPEAADRPVILPSAQPAILDERSRTTQRTAVGADGTVTTETRRRSSSVSVDAGQVLGTLLGAPTPAAAGPDAAAFAGRWTVDQADGSTCTLELVDSRQLSDGSRSLRNVGCFGPLMGVSRWRLRGDEVILASAFASQAVVRPTGRDVLSGDGITLSR